MITTGVLWLNDIVREGEDKNGRYWCHCLAKEFGTKEGEGFICLHLFGSNAEFVERNLGESRRALVTGNIVISSYKEKKKYNKTVRLSTGETIQVPLNITVDKNSIQMNVTSVKFLDSPTVKVVTDDEEDEEIVYEVKGKSKSGEKVTVVSVEDTEDFDDEEMTFTPASEESDGDSMKGVDDSFQFEKKTQEDKAARIKASKEKKETKEKEAKARREERRKKMNR